MSETRLEPVAAFQRVGLAVARALADDGWYAVVAVRGAGPWVLSPPDGVPASPEPAGPELSAALDGARDGPVDATTIALRWPSHPPRGFVLRSREPVPRSSPPWNLLAALIAEGARTERTERLAGALREGVLVTDTSGNVTLASDGAGALLGRSTPAEGASLSHLLPTLADGTSVRAFEPGELACGPLPSLGEAPCGTWSAEAMPDGGLLVRLEGHRDALHLQNLSQLGALRHDLRAPLSAMQGLIAVLASEPDMAPDERARMMTLLEQESERIRDFIDAWIVLLRLRVDPRPGLKRQVGLAQALATCVEAMQPSLMARGVALSLQVSDATVEADPTLFDAFIRSALGFVFKLADVGASVEVAADAAGLEVTGRGPGLFDRPIDRPFTTPGRATTGGKRTLGAPLGLMTTRRIADTHGWRVRLQQRAGVLVVKVCWRPHG